MSQFGICSRCLIGLRRRMLPIFLQKKQTNIRSYFIPYRIGIFNSIMKHLQKLRKFIGGNLARVNEAGPSMTENLYFYARIGRQDTVLISTRFVRSFHFFQILIHLYFLLQIVYHVKAKSRWVLAICEYHRRSHFVNGGKKAVGFPVIG